MAAAVSDDSAETVTAYDTRGHAHSLDAGEIPAQPVYVVDIDVYKALSTRAGGEPITGGDF